MEKILELEKINKEIRKCKICPEGKIGKAVVGEGNADAKIAFVGEAPGRKESQTGRPFIGRSGQLLRKLIIAIGLKEEEVYITSPVKYLPVKGTPSMSDISHGVIHLNKQLSVINPEIIVLLGAVAVKALLPQKSISVVKMHGTLLDEKSKKYFITFHPSAALRFEKYRILIKKDFYKLKRVIRSKA